MSIAEPLVQTMRPEEGIAVVHLRDAEGKNALSAEMVDQLLPQLWHVAGDPEVRVCILSGLPEVFCSGAAKEMLRDLLDRRVAPTDIMLTRAVLEIPVPTIAAMEGHAVGGGLILGLCCDIAIMAHESRYGCSFMNLGFTPGMGTTRLLQRSVGEHLAAEMMFGGQYFRGSHFTGRGPNYVLPRTQVMPKAEAVARRIAEKPRNALTLLKRSLSLEKRLAFEDARTTEAMMHEICFARPETAALVEEQFVDDGE